MNVNVPGQSNLTDCETDLIKRLREDASEVKECFTRFSFQVISLSSVALGLLVRFQPNFPLLGLTSLFVIFVALSVARIGTYKYGTANRHYGYELHLNRVCRLNDSDTGGWKSSYRDIGWEESLRAWRIVQATVFRHLYIYGTGKANILTPEARKIKYPWFDLLLLKKHSVAYHAGSYLRTVFSMLNTIIGCGLLSIFVMAVQLFIIHGVWAGCIGGILFFLILFIAFNRTKQLRARRKLLESGILSIHSSAILWQLVILAHHRSLQKLKGYKDGKVDTLEGYTRELSRQAISLCDYLEPDKDVKQWIDGI